MTFQSPPMSTGSNEAAPEIEGYKIAGVLGAGGMGCVYLAEQVKLGRRVAIKAFLKQSENPESDQLFQRFLNEAKIIAQTEGHESLARVYDLVEDKAGNHYIVMEHIEGQTLLDMANARNGQPMSPDEAMRYIVQAAEGLHHAHQRGVIHRDIKPGNIMVTREGKVKVMDFGLARAFLGFDQESQATKTGTSFGTLAYMPPEQIRNAKDVDSRSDIYALGATLFRLITGRHPYETQNVGYESVLEITQKPAPSPRQFNPGIPEDLDKIIRKAMDKDPNNRYNSAGAFADALKAVRARLGARPGDPPPGGAPEPKPKADLKLPPPPILIGGAAVVLLVVVALLFVMTGGSGPAPVGPAPNFSNLGAAPATVSGAPAAVASAPGAPLSLAEAEQVFQNERLTSAKRKLESLDASDPGKATILHNLAIASEVQELLGAGDLEAASARIAQVDQAYWNANLVEELRERVDLELNSRARAAWDRGNEAYNDERYEEARPLFQEAFSMRPAEYAKASTMAEASRLAAAAKAVLEPARAAVREGRYAVAVTEAREPMEALEAAREEIKKDPKFALIMRDLGDIFHHAQMQIEYVAGRPKEALVHFDQISASHRIRNDLDKLYSKMRQISELVERAEKENSVEIARQVLQLVPDPEHGVYRRMSRLAEEATAERQRRARELVAEGDKQRDERLYDKALESYFKAREADPESKKAAERHTELAVRILDYAKRTPGIDPGSRDKKSKLLEIVKRNSLRTDSVYRQAVNQSNELGAAVSPAAP